MLWAIVITVIITSLIFLVISFRRGYLDKSDECRALRNKNAALQRKLDDNNARDVKRRVNRAYQDGLWDGRETDKAYREILRRTKNGDYDDAVYRYITTKEQV